MQSARVARGAVESNSSFFSFGHAGAWNRLPISTAQNTNHNGKDPDALTSEKEEDQHHDQCVAEVQEGGGCSCDGQFGDKEMNRVQKEIHCSTSAS